MNKVVKLQIRALPLAVSRAAWQIGLEYVKPQVKKVIETPAVSELEPIAIKCSSPKRFDKSSGSAIRGRGRPSKRAAVTFEARAEVTSMATSSLRTIPFDKVAEMLRIGPISFRKGIKAGMYPDYDYSNSKGCYWFEETVMEMIKARDEAGGVCCVKCQYRKPVLEFPTFKKVRSEMCIDCVIAMPGHNLDFEGADEYRDRFTPSDPERTGHDIRKTVEAIEEIRRRAGGIPTDAIRSGFVRRDQVTA